MVDDRAEGESKSEAETSSAGNTPKSGEQKSKRGLDQPIKRMSTAALIGSGVVILLVGLVVGLGAGYKIEQSRTKSDVKKLKAAATTPTPDATPATSATTVRLSGKVGSTKGGVVTLTSASGTRTMATKSSTIVVKALPGNLSDITAGQRVLWQATPGQSTHAEEIVVLPSDAKLGSSVVSVSPTSMQLKAKNGNIKVNTDGAAVEKVAVAKLSDLAVGNKVVAVARNSGSKDTATEIIVLPSTSKFVA